MMSTNTIVEAPTMVPSQTRTDAGTSTAGGSRPMIELPDTLARTGAGTIGQGPTMHPPGAAGAAAAAAVGAVTGTWTSGLMIDATWSINEVRNVFVHVAGGGWKKIFNGTDGAFTALVTLAAQAKQTGHQVAVREEADGMVHEIYLW
jgi:hypothetical protein